VIHYLTTSGHQYPWRSPLEDPRAPVATREELLSRVRLISYERLFRMRVLPAGSYIFADLDRLGVEATERAALLRRVLQEGGPGVRVFNDPIRSMRRFELLRHLYAHGLNAFNVYRLTDVSQVRRFPVFLRDEDGHDRSRPPCCTIPTSWAAPSMRWSPRARVGTTSSSWNTSTAVMRRECTRSSVRSSWVRTSCRRREARTRTGW
jgi:hypothetical protein